MTAKRKIVCTGMGAITPFTETLRDLVDRLPELPVLPKEERLQAINALPGLDSDQHWGDCQFPDEHFSKIRGAKYIDRCTKLLYSASLQFLKKTEGETHDTEGASISVGTAFSTLSDYMKLLLSFEDGGLQGIAPVLFPNTVHNCPTSQLAILLKATGVNITNANGLCAGADALVLGLQLLQDDRSQQVIAGGVEENSIYSKAGFHFSLKENREADFYPVEGAATVLLEEERQAKKRGAPILGEIVSFAQGFYAAGESTEFSLSDQIDRTMTEALMSADIDPDEVQTFSLSLCGVPRLDTAELEAVGRWLQKAKQPKGVFALKKIIGESVGASGVLQLQVALSQPQLSLMKHCQECLPEPFLQEYQSKLSDRFSKGYILINSINWEGNVTSIVAKTAA